MQFRLRPTPHRIYRLKETCSFVKLSLKSKWSPLRTGVTALLKIRLPAPIIQTNPVATGQHVLTAVPELSLLLPLTSGISEKGVQSQALFSITEGNRLLYSEQVKTAISRYITTLRAPVATAVLKQTLPASLLPRQHRFRCQGILQLSAWSLMWAHSINEAIKSFNFRECFMVLISGQLLIK